MTASIPKFDQVKVGDELKPLVLPPVCRHQLALYCGGSGDHNPIHVDLDFAKKFGFKDVFAHGMLSMAFLGRLVDQLRAARQGAPASARASPRSPGWATSSP